MQGAKNYNPDNEEVDINDPWRFAPYTFISCSLSILAGFFLLNFFNIVFTTHPESILTWPNADRIQFILIYFLIPVAEIIAIWAAIKAKKKKEFWYAAAITLAIISGLLMLFIYTIAGNYVFRIL